MAHRVATVCDLRNLASAGHIVGTVGVFPDATELLRIFKRSEGRIFRNEKRR